MTKDSSPDFDKIKTRSKEIWDHKERLKQAAPDRAAIIGEFGKGAVKDHADGSWTASIKHDKDKMMRAERMFKGVRKEQTERHQKTQAEIERERVKTRDGKILDLYAHRADEQAAKMGARPMSKLHGPRDYFSMGSSAAKYQQGMDRLYFVWNGGWEPTNLWRSGAEGPQRDPSGNVWVEVETDGKLSWVLKEELDGPDDGDGDSRLWEESGSGRGRHHGC